MAETPMNIDSPPIASHFGPLRRKLCLKPHQHPLGLHRSTRFFRGYPDPNKDWLNSSLNANARHARFLECCKARRAQEALRGDYQSFIQQKALIAAIKEGLQARRDKIMQDRQHHESTLASITNTFNQLALEPKSSVDDIIAPFSNIRNYLNSHSHKIIVTATPAVLDCSRTLSHAYKEKLALKFTPTNHAHCAFSTTAPAPKSLSLWSGSAVVHGQAANDQFSSEDEPEVADVTANITFMPQSEEAVKSLLPEDASPSEYSFIGKLIRLDLIGLQSQGFDCKCRPIFSVSSLASPVDNTTRSFTLTASLYTKLVKDNKFPSAFSSTFTIPKIPRWSKLPTIVEGGHVTAEGFGVSIARDGDGFVQTIIVEVEKVTLQGKPSMPPVRKSLPISSTVGVKRQNKFSYTDSVKKAHTS
ncbi:hypothetical protein BT96DRAFT_999045 [Gymnopus androsaceus JB14]|uniref:Uncharacterized protein n=1 Tax=Gymnopus androsaceus JB14 TaxID=1447944 RepID=A0A6A4H7T5_9AGAR|nr:hypothetical protein BT96DRAFT_999045 [Gymnopus androsaceus JB14]